MARPPATETNGTLPCQSPVLRHFAWDYGIAAALLIVLVGEIYVNLGGARKTLGIAIAYTTLSIAPPLLLSLLEHLTRPAGPRKSGRRWWLHFEIMLANLASAIPFGLLGAFLADSLVKALGLELGLVTLKVAERLSIAAIVGAFVVGGLIGDFFFYWYHRALHASTILWQHHKLHHMDPEFDALTGPRQNWLESFFGMFFITIPVSVLFKLDSLDPLDIGLLYGGLLGLLRSVVFINHSNLRLQFGRASVLFTSSQNHRIHHSYLPQHADRNFVAFFPIWDILFKTYYHPARDEFPPTGVKGEREIASVWEAQIFPVREWWKLYQAYLKRG